MVFPGNGQMENCSDVLQLLVGQLHGYSEMRPKISSLVLRNLVLNWWFSRDNVIYCGIWTEVCHIQVCDLGPL